MRGLLIGIQGHEKQTVAGGEHTVLVAEHGVPVGGIKYA